MSCGKCGSKGRVACLCPVSFGLALGITCFLIVYICGLWIVYYHAGMSPMMATLKMDALTATTALMYAGWAFLKGLIFGFVLVAVYDSIVCLWSCCCRKRKDGGMCECCNSESCKCVNCKCSCCKDNKKV